MRCGGRQPMVPLLPMGSFSDSDHAQCHGVCVSSSQRDVIFGGIYCGNIPITCSNQGGHDQLQTHDLASCYINSFCKHNWLHAAFRLVMMPGSHCRADSMFATSQWETLLPSNDVSHWLGTNLESDMHWFGFLLPGMQSSPCNSFEDQALVCYICMIFKWVARAVTRYQDISHAICPIYNSYIVRVCG